jgi:hypothetical protein
MRKQIAANPKLSAEHKSENAILDHFRLMQANDDLSLLACVDFQKPVKLLHALPTRDGKHVLIQARAIATRHFVLEPYPFAKPSISFRFPARHAEGNLFR